MRAAAIALLIASVASSAEAIGTTTEPGGPRIEYVPLEPAAPPRVYYGWQTLIVHVTALSLGAAVAFSGQEEGAGFALFFSACSIFGPSFVHILHEQPRNAVLSLAFNVGLTSVVGGLGIGIGIAASQNQGEFGALGGFILGAAIGGGLGHIGAIVLDATYLGYEDEPRSLAAVPVIMRAPDGAPLPGFALAF